MEEGRCDMRFVNEAILAKMKSLPLDRREKVLNGLVRMLAERPKGFAKENQNA
jgi:hypothetical protein